MDEIALIDSNILIYAFDRSEPKKYDICNKLLKKCWEGEEKLAISVQNLSEFYVAVTKKIESPIEKSEALELIRNIIAFHGFKILHFDSKTIPSAIKINITYEVPYWDALLAATMQEGDIRAVYTENAKDFKKIPWVQVINPVEDLV